MMKKCSVMSVIRVLIISIALLGLASIIVGSGIGLLAIAGTTTTRLTLCLLMIAVGSALLAVSAFSYRLTVIEVRSSSTNVCTLLAARSTIAVDHNANLAAAYFDHRYNNTINNTFPYTTTVSHCCHPSSTYCCCSTTMTTAIYLSNIEQSPPAYTQSSMSVPPPVYSRTPISLSSGESISRPPSYRSIAAASVMNATVDDREQLIDTCENVQKPTTSSSLINIIIDCSKAIPIATAIHNDNMEEACSYV